MSAPGSALIRDFRPEDTKGISALFRRIYGSHYIYPEVYLPAMIRERNAVGAWRTAVAELNGEIVAHAALVRAWPAVDCAEIALTAALPEAAGRGLGVRVCRHLCDGAAQAGIGMLTAMLVCSHVQSQRMARPLGFATTGLLFDYLPSSFTAEHRESYVLSCRALAPWPLPDIAWPDACRHWLDPVIGRYGLQAAAAATADTGSTAASEGSMSSACHAASAIEVASGSGLITLTIDRPDDSALEQACGLPPERLTLLRMRPTGDLCAVLERLAAHGYRNTGLMPAPGAGWYWLMQRGFRAERLQLHCSLAAGIAAGQNVRCTSERGGS